MLLLLACAAPTPTPSSDSASTVDVCTPPYTVVTDIDETLTTADEEWHKELADPTYDPAMRPDANTLMAGYAGKGYTLVYVTGRYAGEQLPDGTDAVQATTAWLQKHAFPLEDGNLHLAPESGLYGSDLQDYKAGVIEAMTGWTPVYAYGNATTDIGAYQDAGLPDDHIFLVGKLAGELGVNGIPDADAYANHLHDWLPGVAEATCDD